MRDGMMKDVRIWLVYSAVYIKPNDISFDVSINYFSNFRSRYVAQSIIVAAGTPSTDWIPGVLFASHSCRCLFV